MRACLVAIHRRWSVAVATEMVPLLCPGIMLVVLTAGSPVVAHEPEGFVVPHGHAPRFSGPAGGEANSAEILATREQTGGVWGVWRYTAQPAFGPPLHIHRAEDEFFYVLRGEFALQLGDCITLAPAGSFVYIPKDTIHTYQNVGTEPGELLGGVTPGGFEHFFIALPGADADTVQALSTQHAMDAVGPPLELATSPARLATLRWGTAAAPPAPSSAKTYRIGVLAPGCHPPAAALDLLLHGLRDRGYVEGQNLRIEWRYSEGKAERFPELAAELVRQKVDLIVAMSTPAALAAKHATQTIPIVMVYVADPVGTGLVPSLAQPGGNITGVTDMATDLSGKRLELLKEAIPTLSRVAVLWNVTDPGMVLRFRELETAARVLGLTLQSHEVRGPKDFGRAFAAMRQARPDALFVVSEVLTIAHRCQVLDFAAEQRLPTMAEFGLFAQDGGLMAYGPKLTDTFQRGAYHVDKILQGTKPAHLPIEQPMQFELIINPKTAQTLGLTLPPTLLFQADRGEIGGENRCARVW
jgi:putative ABC transport system substrate-binding protein